MTIKNKDKILRMYKERKISLAKAAEMLKINMSQMIGKIKKKNLYLDYSNKELKEDLKGLK
jgi:predicted HTH domain antitoxin